MKQVFTKADDKKFYLEVPDANFSPQRNKAIIDMTIRKYRANRKKKAMEYVEPYRERAEAVISYLKSKPGMALDKYFTPKYLAYLRGDEIRKELMAGMTILDNEGNEVKKFIT